MISKTDVYLFEQAVKLAEFGEHRVRVGAVAATGRTKVAGAFNTHRNKSKVDFTAITFHAEHNLLRLLPYNLRKRCTVYVARIGVKSDLCNSYPCTRCVEKLRRARIRKVVFYKNGEIRSAYL